MFMNLWLLAPRQVRCVILLVSLSFVFVSVFILPTQSQSSFEDSSLPTSENLDRELTVLNDQERERTLPPLRRPGIMINRIGNIHYANVRLDGHPLIQVAAEVPTNRTEDEESPLPIEERVERIQSKLKALVTHSTFDPNQAEVIPSILNGQTVLIFTRRNRELILLTVTELDAQLADTSIEKLAEIWRHDILAALIRAWQERQPPYLQQQGLTATLILGRVIVISALLFLIQRIVDKRNKTINKELAIAAEAAQELPSSLSEPFPRAETHRASLIDQVLHNQLNNIRHLISQRRLLIINRLPQRLLFWGQVFLWIIGWVYILNLFPQTREIGSWVLGIPLVLLIIVLIMNILSRVIQMITQIMIDRWLEINLRQTSEVQAKRLDARAQTLTKALLGLENNLFVVIGVFVFLYAANIPLTPLLTGAGVLGLIISIGAQGLVRDYISGCLILLEDQYALGDWVIINGIFGEVERMGLRVTKLRSLEGHLISIPNGTIDMAENATNEWANVNFQIDVDYQMDAERILQLMKQTSEELKRDPKWESVILDPVFQLVMIRLSHEGQRMRILIKTQPGWQWPVEFEYRRRLKSVFDREGVAIGIPRHLQFYERKDAKESPRS